MRSKEEIKAMRQKFVDKIFISERDRQTMLLDETYISALGWVLEISSVGDS